MEAIHFHNSKNSQYLIHFNNSANDLFVHTQANIEGAEGRVYKDLYTAILLDCPFHRPLFSHHYNIHLTKDSGYG